MKVILKEGDVYQFRNDYDKNPNHSTHCFESLLVVMRNYDKELILVDTFWGVNRLDNKQFTLKKILEKGKIEFYCNLKDIKSIENNDTKYYNDDDIYFLHNQHACVESCKYYYISKGAKKCKDKMLSVINEKLRKSKSDVEYEVRNVERYSEIKTKIENDDLSVYL